MNVWNIIQYCARGFVPVGLIVALMLPTLDVIAGDRTEVSDTTIFPWRTICKIYAYFYVSPYFEFGSGVIIDDFHVYTAAHVVYKSGPLYPYKVTVIPGYDSGNSFHGGRPFHESYSTFVRVPAEYADPGDEHDWALVTLDRSVGTYTVDTYTEHNMELATYDPSDSVYTGTLRTAGYPLDKGGSTMWWQEESGDSADDYNHWYNMDTFSGQSGSAVWYESGSEPNIDRYILTIHTWGGTPSKGTRLTEARINTTNGWITDDETIRPPTDKPDLLYDDQDNSYFSPTTVEHGTDFTVSCDLRNMGTASSGTFDVTYYASLDDEITTSDYVIGADENVSSIEPFLTTGTSQWSGPFPETIPAGSYYIGWIIDSGGDVDEFAYGEGDENNSFYEKDYQLQNDGPPTMVVLSSFTAMAEDSKVILVWRTEAELDNVGFAIYRSGTKDGDYTRIAFVNGAQDSETSNNYQFTDEQAQPSHTYYYYLEDVDLAGKRTKSDVIRVTLPAFPAVRVLAQSRVLPRQSSLLYNYPNPFNPETWIPYNLAAAADVTVQIYDARGHLIRTLHPGYQPADFYLDKDKAAYWNGQDNTGEQVSGGVYFYRLSAGNFSAMRKMIVLE